MDFSDPLVFLAVLAMVTSGFVRLITYTEAWQRWLHKPEGYWGDKAWMTQPYSIFLCGLTLYFVDLIWQYSRLMYVYGWLDPQHFVRPPVNGTQLEALKGFDLPVWIGAASQLTPFAVAGTFVVTALHVWEHLRPRKAPFHQCRWLPSLSHDLAIQVIMLPLVYGLFALDNVVTALQVFTGDCYLYHRGASDYEAWLQVTDKSQASFEQNLQIADLYEAWALRCFGLLCFVLVHRQVLLEAPTVTHLIKELMGHFKLQTDLRQEPERPALFMTGSEREAYNTRAHRRAAFPQDRLQDREALEELKIMKDPDNLLFRPLQNTQLLGVQVFVFTYAFKSLYSLGLAFTDAEANFCGPQGTLNVVCSLVPYAEGAAMLASTLAIMNIVVFESSLHSVLENFRPVPKFLSVKILVSIVFFQKFGLEVVLGGILLYSEIQISLAYACIICLEVMALSLVSWGAWRPDPLDADDWYDGDLNRRYEAEENFDPEQPDQDLVDFPYDVGQLFQSKEKNQRHLLTLRPDEDGRAAWLKIKGEVRPDLWASLGTFMQQVSNSRVTLTYYPPGFAGLRPGAP